MFSTSDPLVNVWDLGADPMKFAQDRILLAEELLKGLADRVVDKGEGYQRARLAFGVLLGQYGNGAYLVGQLHRRRARCTAITAATRAAAIRSCRSRRTSSARR